MSGGNTAPLVGCHVLPSQGKKNLALEEDLITVKKHRSLQKYVGEAVSY